MLTDKLSYYSRVVNKVKNKESMLRTANDTHKEETVPVTNNLQLLSSKKKKMLLMHKNTLMAIQI